MKKKIYLAVLAACMTLTLSACGQDTVKKDDTKAEQTAEDTEKDEDTKKRKAKNGLVSVKNVEDYIQLGTYKGIELQKNIIEITEEQVQAAISREIGAGSEVDGGTVQAGDTVTIDYVGTKDGEAFEGGSAEGYDLLIGSGSFIDGFEDGLIGMKKGETRHLDLTFPEDYKNKEMAGQAVTFQVTLEKFVRPQLTDEWAAENTEYKTAAEYEEAVRAALTQQADLYAVQAMKQSAWEQLLVGSEVTEYPQQDLDDAEAECRQDVEIYADQAGMELDAFLESQGVTKESFEELCQQYAQAKVKQNLIVQAIMDAEGMSLNDDESLAIQEQLIAQLGAESMADLVDLYGQEMVDESVGILRVENFILENATIVENGPQENTQENAEENAEENTEAAEAN